MEEISRIIKGELEARGLRILKMVLFGSRAKGSNRPDSDWDILVVIDKRMNFMEKWEIIDAIKIRLARLSIPNDIILKSEEEIEESKDNVGKVTYYALREGIEI